MSENGIKGYRELTEEEKTRINTLKEMEKDLLAVLDATKNIPDINQRSLALAVTNIQQGFMWAVRAIARPNGE